MAYYVQIFPNLPNRTILLLNPGTGPGSVATGIVADSVGVGAVDLRGLMVMDMVILNLHSNQSFLFGGAGDSKTEGLLDHGHEIGEPQSFRSVTPPKIQKTDPSRSF